MGHFNLKTGGIMRKILLGFILIFILGCSDKTDENGFYIEGKNIGIHKETKTKYNKEGYNKGGFTRYGLNKENKFDKNKFYKYKFEESKYIREEIQKYKEVQKFLFTGINSFFKENEELNKKLKELKKGDFETTKEFKERYNNLSKLIEKSNENIIDIKKEYYIIYPYEEIEGKYDADNEEWIFSKEIDGFSNSIYLGNSNYLEIMNSPIKINTILKMNRELAKQKQKETINIRFLATDTSKLKSTYISNVDEYVRSNFTIELRSYDITYFTAKIVGYQIFTGYGTEQKLIQEVFLD